MNASVIKKIELTLVGFMGILLLPSCEKEKSGLPAAEITEENIEGILEEGFNQYEDLITTESPETAKRATLDKLVKSDYVTSGKVIDQGIFITFSDGTQGGILTDGEDGPEYDKIPETPERETSVKSSKIQNQSPPLITKTIFLNPHYYERKKFADWLINKYKSYFPIAGYEEPEVYLNEKCTLDKFASLGDYGIIHIYSHGIKISEDTVLLLTGEPINSASTTKYSDEIKSKTVFRFRLRTAKNVYVVSPDFIKKNNNFKDENKLVYGGFCYSFLGGWPQMFYDNYKGGYFGFNNSVYTDKNVKWAEDLLYRLSYPYNFEPETAMTWRYNTSLGSSYINNENEDVSIKYMGLNDLTLWQWETALWEHKFYRFTVKVDATIQTNNGAVILKNDTIIHQCTGQGTFSGNIYSGASLQWSTNKESYGGHLTFNIDPITFNITNFTISDTTGYSLWGITETDIMKCNLSELPYSSSADPFVDGAYFLLIGDAINDNLSFLSDYLYQNVNGKEKTETLINFSVDENSEIRFELLWSK
ncbi:hypothetical protein ACE1ET_14500 [Saccharicrinis sp. FJH62]|uniref:hypothetical protein n=1 Tax=Saccharicrinis sp. FJH62 TaxID=3344657 RepID=UPI0035D51590